LVFVSADSLAGPTAYFDYFPSTGMQNLPFAIAIICLPLMLRQQRYFLTSERRGDCLAGVARSSCSPAFFPPLSSSSCPPSPSGIREKRADPEKKGFRLTELSAERVKENLTRLKGTEA